MNFVANPSSLCDRPDYFGPGCNIASADVVGVGRKAASGADEFGLCPTVRLIDVSTFWACPACVSRVHSYNGNSRKSCFVANERTKLPERPRVQHAPLSFSYGYPSTDAREVLDSNSSFGAFSFADNCFGNNVVRIRMKMAFPSSKLAKVPLGAFSACTLKLGSKLGDATTRRKDSGTRMGRPVGVHGKVTDAQVHSQPPVGLDGRAIRHFDGYEQVEFSLSVDEVGLPSHAFKPSAVVRSDCARHDHAPVDGQKAQAIEPFFEAVQTLVDRNGSVRLEFGANGPVSAVGFAHLGNGPNGVLRRQSKQSAQIPIIELLKANLVSAFGFECPLSEPATRLIHTAHRIQKALRLLAIGEELYACDQLHAHGLSTSMTKNNRKKQERRFLPRLLCEAGASTLEIR